MESIPKSVLETKLLELCEKTLMPQGFRAVDVDLKKAGRSIVRIFIERMAGPGEGLASIDDCANASRLMSPLLETDSLIEGPFELEVSSPGLDRRLRLKSDFLREIGQEVKLKLDSSEPGIGANPRGKLIRVEEDKLVILVSGKEYEIAFSRVQKANRIWNFNVGEK